MAQPLYGRDELQRRGVRRGGGDDGGVLHGADAGEALDDLRDGRALLADGDVEAVHVAALLVDDGVDGDGGLAGLAVADDQLALAAADGDHRVDGLEAGLHRLLHRLALDDAGRLELDAAGVRRVDRALAVDRLAERVDDAAEQRLADRHLGDAAGAPDLVALADLLRLAEDGGADVVLFEVEHQAVDVVRELQQLAGGGLVEAVDAGDAVAGGQHAAGLAHLDVALVLLDLALDDVADFRGADFHSLCSSLALSRGGGSCGGRRRRPRGGARR